jgi:hypothetical protein
MGLAAAVEMVEKENPFALIASTGLRPVITDVSGIDGPDVACACLISIGSLIK